MKQLIIMNFLIFTAIIFSQDKIPSFHESEFIIQQQINKITKPGQPQKDFPPHLSEDPGQSFNTFEIEDEYVPTEIIYQLGDSTTWENNYRTLYEYTPNGFFKSYTIQNWDGTLWVNYTMYEYEHNAQNKIEFQYFYNWDGAQWVYTTKYEYEYDANGYNNITTRYTWDGFIWINSFKYLYEYDSNGNTTEDISQEWSGSAWVNVERYENEYDENNNKTLNRNQIWNGSTWENVYQYLITYINNNYSEYTYQTWNGTSWDNDFRFLYTYDLNNLRITYKYQDWNGSNWVDIYRYNYTYDGSHIISSTQQNWNGSQWVNHNRDIYTWDNDLKVSYLSQFWNGSGWDNSFQGSYTYDSNNNQTVASNQRWNNTYNYWENDDRFLYSYILITDVEDELTSVIDYSLSQNYPNPFNPSTVISYQLPELSQVTLKVYDILGREVATLVNQKQVAGNYEIEFSGKGLSSGIYFYQLKSDNFLDVKKMILLK